MKRLFLLGLLMAFAASASAAEQSTARYSFMPVEGGVLRLDAETGEVAFCAVAAGVADCAAPALAENAQENGADAEARIRALEQRIAALEAGSDAEAYSDEETMDRVMLLSERMMRRFFGLVREMKRDLETNEL